MCCCLLSRLSQILLFVFNFLLVVAGLALLVIGVLAHLNFESLIPEDFNDAASVAPILLIVVGCVIFSIAFLGCCGAMKKSKCMLIMYIVNVVCILIVQIVAGSYALTAIQEGDNKLQEELNKIYKEIFEKYMTDPVYKDYIDTVQQKLECCGVTTPNDWKNSPPPSCFEGNNTNNEKFKNGCVGFVYDAIADMSEMIGKVALGLCVTEILTIVFAFLLICC